uniref:Uncharacterized protein n=1 Tax=Avena sativa TaxID=4498 RepID=A0ACD5Z8T1_AVESA
MDQLCLAEKQKWTRRAKIKWCKLGDENMKFFHTIGTYRFRKNKICVFRNGQQEYFAEVDKLKIATEYFRDLFSEGRAWEPCIDIHHLYSQQSHSLQNLADPFTWEEIQQAVQDAPASKIPAPDGFTNEFYHLYLPELKDNIMEIFQAFHNKSINLDGVKSAFIALLPKNETP